jgi:hypothetical protein
MKKICLAMFVLFLTGCEHSSMSVGQLQTLTQGCFNIGMVPRVYSNFYGEPHAVICTEPSYAGVKK